MSLPNHFADAAVARRYVQGRPYVHEVVAQEIVRHAGRVERAVDVGAGTGLSTRALLRCTASVIGVDPSVEMLAAACRNSTVRYVCGTAERLPLPSASMDLATLSAAFHWCDHSALFSELERVVRPGGWLAIYDVELANVIESPSLVEWLHNDYWRSLPRCAHLGVFDAATHVRPPFTLVSDTRERTVLPVRADDLIAFVLSQASSINAVTTASVSFDALERRLRRAISAVLPRDIAATVVFDIPFSILRRS